MISRALFFISVFLILHCSNPMETNVLHGVNSINFYVPNPAYVKCSIENSFGTIVEVLVDKNLQPGTYSFMIKNDLYHEGIYFYTIFLDKEKYYSNSFIVLGK